jgi:hypothetical protein
MDRGKEDLPAAQTLPEADGSSRQPLPQPKDTMPEGWLAELANIEENADNISRLISHLSSYLGIVPFIGEGLLLPFGLPDWNNFLLTQARKAGLEGKINKCLEGGDSEQAVEQLLLARGHRAFHDAIGSAFGAHRLKGLALEGNILHVPKLAQGPVITTTFDHILEEVFKQAGTPFEYIVWGANIEIAASARLFHRKILLKIPGNAEDSRGRILTKGDYAKYYGIRDGSKMDFSLPFPQFLRRILYERSVLFLGTLIIHDRFFTVLKEVLAESPNVAHFAILEKPVLENEFKQRTNFLAYHNIRAIWYPNGRHDFMGPLLAYLAGKSHRKN